MDWRFSTFLLLLFTLLFGITWATSETGLCHSKFVIEVMAQQNKDGALNCFDFWLNRYQTLITGGFAALAALIALGQLKAARQQGAVAVRQSALTSFEFWTARLSEIREMQRISDVIINEAIKVFRVIYTQEFDTDQRQSFETMKESAAEFRSIYDRYVWTYVDKPVRFDTNIRLFIETARDIDFAGKAYRRYNNPHPSVADLKEIFAALQNAKHFALPTMPSATAWLCLSAGTLS